MASNIRTRGAFLCGERQPRRPQASRSSLHSAPTENAWPSHGSTSDGITIHDVSNGALLSTLKTSSKTFAFSADGQWIAYAENLNLLLWQVGSDQSPAVLDSTLGQRQHLAFSPDGRTLAVASGDHVMLFDLAKRLKSKILQGHRERITDVAFSPDGKWIATGSLDYTARIWEVQTGECIATLPTFGSPAFAVKWSPNGEYLATIENNIRQLFLYKITGRQGVRQWLAGHTHELGCIAAHPALEEITTCGYFELHRWDLAASPVSGLEFERDPGGGILSVAYSPDGALIATASWEFGPPPVSRQILIRDANTGKERSRIKVTDFIYALAFDPKGGQLACGDSAGDITLYDLATNRRRSEVCNGKLCPFNQLSGTSALHAYPWQQLTAPVPCQTPANSNGRSILPAELSGNSSSIGSKAAWW